MTEKPQVDFEEVVKASGMPVTETGINTPAETWQIDFTARMGGMDERQRIENTDIYGAAAFFGNGYLVAKTGNQFFVTKGTGYVAGLRASLAANQNITVATKPVKVWLDVCWTGTLTSVWNVQSKITVAANLADYVQNGVQHTDLLLRWFTGYVERSQPAENGYQRLFIRELAGVFERMWPCSFQHPTLRDVAGWLTENSGIGVSVPDVSYSDTPIPHFTHNGTGYQLLNNLGRAFSIQDYIWYQLPDGSLYVGGAEKSLFTGRPVEVPAEFSQGAAGGNTITLPVIQTIRPGVELNGERVTKVHLTNDTMTITWTPRNRVTGSPLQKTPTQRQIESHYPELASGLHLPKMARVVAHTEPVKSGNFADPFRPRYAVDVQLLDADGNPDNQTPVYSAVPLPVPMAGNDSGMFQFPPEGTLVEVAFTGGRPDKPFIRQTLPDGTSLPDVKPGEQLQ